MKIKSCLLALLIVFFTKTLVSADGLVIVPSLMYHNINDVYDMKNLSVEISGEMFKEHMETLKKNGYT